LLSVFGYYGVLVWLLSTESASINLPMETDWPVLPPPLRVFTCAFFGTVPALRATDTEPVNAMKADGLVIAIGFNATPLHRSDDWVYLS
jgi:hypothetical protein